MDLLLELFSEEIPARMQDRAARDLRRLMTAALGEAGLTHKGGRAFSTPRRLVLALTGLSRTTREKTEERRGPRVDAPEKVIEGFLRSTGLSREQLEIRDDKKGQVYFATIHHKGRPAAEIVAEAVRDVIHDFPWPKSMRWGAGNLRWVRPLHSILCILSDEEGARVVPIEIEGLVSGDTTRGHRFKAPDPFRVTGFEDYAEKLEAAFVVLDAEERARRIEADAATLAFAQGLEIVPDPALLAEVAGLVEWPVALMGEIGEEFLDLPPEVLRESMRGHQKFFSAREPKTGRITHFVTIANIDAPDGGKAILEGNGRVLSARLADAAFFWERDLRIVKDRGMEGLEEMAKPLDSTIFHAKLGTQGERVERIAALAREIAPKVGADPDQAEQAARIAKVDLASDMVGEFPELQGVMGRYYAEAAGLAPEVACASEAHYHPLGPSAEVPNDPISIAVALADKLDMLTGFWAIDEKPTGSRDPFALRRAALGVIRVVLAIGLRLKLVQLSNAQIERHREDARARRAAALRRRGGDSAVMEGYVGERPRFNGTVVDQATIDLLSFFADRLKVHLRDQDIRHDVIQACFDLGGQDDLVLLVNRVRALQDFLGTDDGENLLIAYRRAANIVSAEEQKDGVEYSGAPSEKFAELAEEHALFKALDAAEPAIGEALEREDFATAIAIMARLRAPVDAFFDKVTVNAENPIVRRNRLCLLARLRDVMRALAIWDAIEG